jgi:hypothetical protein
MILFRNLQKGGLLRIFLGSVAISNMYWTLADFSDGVDVEKGEGIDRKTPLPDKL